VDRFHVVGCDISRSISSSVKPSVSGTFFQKYATAVRLRNPSRKKVPALEIVFKSVRNEIATTKFAPQLAMVAMLIGYALIAASYAFNLNPKAAPMDWDAAWWIIPYLVGMLVISYFGDFGAGGIVGGIGFFHHVLDQGGNDDIGLWGGLIAVAVWSLIIYYLAINKRLPAHKVDEYVAEVYPPPVAE